MTIEKVLVPILLITGIDCLLYYDVRVRRAKRLSLATFITIGVISYVVPFGLIFGQQLFSPRNVLNHYRGAAVLASMLAGYALVAVAYYGIAFLLTEIFLRRYPVQKAFVLVSSLTVFFVLQIPISMVTMIGIPFLVSGRLP